MVDPVLDSEIRNLKWDHEAATSRLKKLTRIGQVLSIVFVLVLSGYLVSLYGKVTTMYSPEQFQGPLQAEAQSLLPRLEPELLTLWQETAPRYGELAMQKFEEAFPAVQEASGRELDTLLANLNTNVENRLNESLDRLGEKHQRQFEKHFPTLVTTEGTNRMGESWMVSIEDDLESVVAHFQNRFVDDLAGLQEELHQFGSPEFESMSEDELTREFLHLWLMKMDRMVLLEDRGQASGNGEDTDHD